MGLDIYARWGEVIKVVNGDYVYEELYGWDNTGEWSDYYKNQITGFEAAPESGYLRESWGSLRWVNEFCESAGCPQLYGFFDDWRGSNGEEMQVNSGKLELLKQHRENLIKWLASSKMPDDDEARKEHRIFVGRVRRVIGFINFVEVHKDKKNLVVIFG